MTSSASNSDLPKTGLQLHIGTTLQQAIDSLRQYPWSTPLLLAFLSLAFLVYACPSFSTTARRRKDSEQTGKSTTTSMADTSPTAASAKSIPALGQVRVSKLLIHPIKSCRGTSVQSANYTPEGLENDRIWCIIDAKAVRVLTAREISKMVLITPTIEENGTLKISFPEESGIAPISVPMHPAEDVLKKWKVFSKTITLWPGVDVDGYVCEAVSGPRGQVSLALSKFLEKPVHLVLKGPIERKIVPTPSHPDLDSVTKFQDGYPLLVLSEESTASVDEYTQKHIGTQGIDERWKTDKVTIERFRPNIVFSGGGAFAEDDWEEISIGSASAPIISLVSKCTRCLLPNVSPETGVRDNAVPFKVLMKFRTGIDPKHKLKPCVGCNAVPRASGTVKVGDVVYVKKMSSAP